VRRRRLHPRTMSFSRRRRRAGARSRPMTCGGYPRRNHGTRPRGRRRRVRHLPSRRTTAAGRHHRRRPPRRCRRTRPPRRDTWARPRAIFRRQRSLRVPHRSRPWTRRGDGAFPVRPRASASMSRGAARPGAGGAAAYGRARSSSGWPAPRSSPWPPEPSSCCRAAERATGSHRAPRRSSPGGSSLPIRRPRRMAATRN